MEENIDYKKKYILENINKISDHQNYVDIIEYYKTKYTKNCNGIFINLNTLDDYVINDFFFKLKNEIEDTGINKMIIKKKNIEEEINILLKKKKKKKKKIKI